MCLQVCGSGSANSYAAMSRMFWPKEIWGKYAKTLEDFKAPENARQAVGCLNELVTDALRHAPHCLLYMAKLRNPDVFRFCAIPQVGNLHLIQ